ncbi:MULTISPECIES: Holliday junction resolvase RuvX [Pseudoxanthomonas]|uniref:Holliday junction resolvase RuvX n=1 Tax=Pseudoxanthomonas TaxID=83618 RepID=UPI001391C30D|nr:MULTISPECIES: Holliday junction resolvase RuvX [Pseudoxanthomonas]KAF1698865.1 Holliday junction resolvase RuvX [Pseudoxanthomonas jiangsuensis]MCR6687487.1 Holliday junction resolvase RuvX [Pseudoxanthomonas sp.]
MPESAAPPSALPPADAIVLGFDVGSRRIGVAVGSAFGGARAIAVVDVHGAGPDWNALERLHREWRPRGLVVGDPMTLEGEDQPARRRARAFAHELRARWALPVAMVDERSSSVEAAQRFARERAAGNRRRRDAEALDAAAAAVIIERWLAAPGEATPL